ncbi:hypothetical protein L1987_28367 [Smallanthus sonchifolius]|uniref:Uncharacterized protein n=1 Tax=Smallanthus sonchifolius TaxID=185202 RepID=A0ACB9HX10_9ASTR|nr:hypothetical protein L1987_28367 [Smallanthus sonchifolius]
MLFLDLVLKSQTLQWSLHTIMELISTTLELDLGILQFPPQMFTNLLKTLRQKVGPSQGNRAQLKVERV